MTRGHVTMMALGATVLAAVAVIAVPAFQRSVSVGSALLDDPTCEYTVQICESIDPQDCPSGVWILGVCVPAFDSPYCGSAGFEDWDMG